MKIYFTISLIFFVLVTFSQEINNDKDSIINNESIYIEDHTNQLNIRFDVSNNHLTYKFPYDDNLTATVKTNLNISYGFVFSYKYFSVRLGIRPKLSDSDEKNKGKTDNFRIGITMLFDKWSHAFEYNYRRGYYLDNTDDFPDINNTGDFSVQFPSLTTNTITGFSQYKFNDNYSIRAVESNTEIQLKSAGTFMPGIIYSFYTVKGLDKVKISEDETITRDKNNDYLGITFILEPSYHYTFVLHKYWYANIAAAPGIGFDFYKTTYISSDNSHNKNFNRTFFSFKTGASLGYNGKNIYFGCEFNYNIFSENYDKDDISFQPIRAKGHAFIGYRFKAPKPVTIPIDYIEEKVPVLKKDNG